MPQAVVVIGPGLLPARLSGALALALESGQCSLIEDPRGGTQAGRLGGTSAVVVVPGRYGRRRTLPDIEGGLAALRASLEAGVERLILISSTEVYEPTTHHPGCADETRLAQLRTPNPIPRAWRRLESLARELAPGALIVLRSPPVPLPGARDPWSVLLTRRFATTVFGHDPVIQLLSLSDLTAAVAGALKAKRPGTFNLAPAGPLHLRRVLRGAGVHRLSAPYSLQAAARTALAPLGLTAPACQLESLRYPWTVSDARARRELGFEPAHGTAEVAAALARQGLPEMRSADPFGFDPEYLDFCCRYPLRFLHDVWFRAEVADLHHVPERGRVVLAGLHRGFVPFDAMMILHLLHTRLGRHARFLVHPGLLKFPVIFDFITKVGGMVACRENAQWVLDREGAVGILPEGVRGAFTPYREAYRLGRFYRDDFVKIALRFGAPIVPFVTVGAAEVFPLLALVRWRWWRRWAQWPGFPITPLPLPLPAKFHTRFLTPVRTDEYPCDAARDPEVVAAISEHIRAAMQAAIDEILSRRRSVFRGDVF